MIVFPRLTLPSAAASEMYRRAKHGIYTGTGSPENMKLIKHCTGYWFDSAMISVIIFTRDEGHHSMGIFKNPDYERCLHLSLSFRDLLTQKSIPKDREATKMWVNVFFSPDDQKKLWIESPKSDEGKLRDVWHYRMFCDEHWRGIIPRREVYTSEFTELGWKSFSELNDGAEAIMAGWGESK
ncbi:MAG: hypothetical protein A4E65_00125 [Syntrophorhabdus sp. PtaU1.Bin153]|nr:MAG: hypothetical protein A4E65_00125 [Syntrophorhabdus sp. PtaU1.Bin153]